MPEFRSEAAHAHPVDAPDAADAPETKEKGPVYRFMISRHAERDPSGRLTPQGEQHATETGEGLAATSEVVKSYASTDKSKRTRKTGELISMGSGTKSVRGEAYATREKPGISYDILKPDLADDLKKATAMIDKATIEELGLPPSTKLDELPPDELARVAPVRQKNQAVGFRHFIQNSAMVHRIGLGLASQLTNEFGIAQRYQRKRRFDEKPPEKDVVLNTATHGLFIESLVHEAGVVVRKDGTEERGFRDFESPEFGGFIQPTESVFLDIKDPDNIPERIPVTFEGENRPKANTVFIERSRLLELNREYEEREASQAQGLRDRH